MFGPLYFPTDLPRKFSLDDDESSTPSPILCLLCENIYNFPNQHDDFFLHLFDEHQLVIADVHLIAKLTKYLQFWKSQLSFVNDLKVHCSTMLVDVERDGVVKNQQEYFLLSDIDPIDKQLREDLQKERLEEALSQQAFEREDKNYKQGCLYCRLEFESTRADYLNHLCSKHNLQLGRPENLVYIDKLINTLRAKMDNLQCIYCEKFFKDRHVLKEHMRKKLHKRINPNNKMYDKFFIVNYLEMGRSWTGDKTRRDSDAEEDPCDWSDWKEDLEMSIVCLFCDQSASNWEGILNHMEVHGFNYLDRTSELTFYEQIKLVNYIRRQVYKSRCIVCDEVTPNLLDHMIQCQHLTVPPRHLWDQPEFYFPTYENDAFLCQLNDDGDEDGELSDSITELKLSQEEGASDAK